MKVKVTKEINTKIPLKKIGARLKEIIAKEINIDPSSIDNFKTEKGYLIIEGKADVNYFDIEPDELISKNIKQVLKEKGYNYKKEKIEFIEGK